VQSLFSLMSKINCQSEFGSLITNLQYFVTDYMNEIDEFEHHFRRTVTSSGSERNRPTIE